MGLKLGSLTLGPQCLLIMSPRGGIWASTPLKPSAEHFLSDTNFKTHTLTFSYLIFSTTYLEPLLQTRKLLKSEVIRPKKHRTPQQGPPRDQVCLAAESPLLSWIHTSSLPCSPSQGLTQDTAHIHTNCRYRLPAVRNYGESLQEAQVLGSWLPQQLSSEPVKPGWA